MASLSSELDQGDLSLADKSPNENVDGALSSSTATYRTDDGDDMKSASNPITENTHVIVSHPSSLSPSREAPTYKTLTEFHLFNKLPLELQSAILEQALPKLPPRIVKFGLKIEERPALISMEEGRSYESNIQFIVTTTTTSAKSPHLLSLLLASKACNQAVTRGGFERISVSVPINDDSKKSDHQKENPNLRVTYRVGGTSPFRDYTWMRPTQDILLVHAVDLFWLYQHGGSMNLASITHLAVHNIPEHFWGSREDVEITKNLWKTIFVIAEEHCPALTKLSLLIGSDYTGNDDTDEEEEDEEGRDEDEDEEEEEEEEDEEERDEEEEDEEERDEEEGRDEMGEQPNILIDVDEDIHNLNFRDVSNCRSVDYEEAFGIEELFIFNDTSREIEIASGVLKEYLEEWGVERKVSYWETVEVLPAFRAWYSSPTELCVPDLSAVVPVDFNGQLTYKTGSKVQKSEASRKMSISSGLP